MDSPAGAPFDENGRALGTRGILPPHTPSANTHTYLDQEEEAHKEEAPQCHWPPHFSPDRHAARPACRRWVHA